MRSTSFKVFSTLSVMSSRFPMGVDTMYSVPDMASKSFCFIEPN